ncbi:hypothetical protein BGP77_11045 [Saccharospirillum sp. MSK14-1]|uniref:hypothetical protein n=1 Tax=Saccharospirillum sp. MSK14-1 TaxID=1897632 RepID=UPI000D478095|nr:hypothetical protein [Saccharospirillum sp. MSK14-1]PTY38708.1 hypothetical protein BGP77_11045 [Saccharospirillum sp. MSK14-1]
MKRITPPLRATLVLLTASAVLTACQHEPPAAVTTAQLTPVAGPSFQFRWQGVPGATHYRLLENPDGEAGYTPVAELTRPEPPLQNDTPTNAPPFGHYTHRLDVPLHLRLNANYIVQSCNAAGCTDSAPLPVTGHLAEGIGYLKPLKALKASGYVTEGAGQFGGSVSLNDAGNRLVVGATGEHGRFVPIQTSKPDEHDNSLLYSGAVYVFNRVNGRWVQEAYIKANNAAANEGFGQSVSFNAAGDVLAVGAAPYYGDINSPGRVYFFVRENGQWRQQAEVVASNAEIGDRFGVRVRLNDAGNRVAVSADNEGSNSRNTDPQQDPTNNDAPQAGAVYIFDRQGEAWLQTAYLKASNTDAGDFFGSSISLNGPGNILAVAAPVEASNARNTDTEPDPTNNGAPMAGAVYLFELTNTTWQQSHYLKASNTNAVDRFGNSVSLNQAGDRLVVGAQNESSAPNDDQHSNSLPSSGAVYVFEKGATDWQQTAFLKASNADEGDGFGQAVSLNNNGDLLAVAGTSEQGGTIGLKRSHEIPADDNALDDAGAVYVYKRFSETDWRLLAFVKPSARQSSSDLFGYNAVELAGESNALTVGMNREDSNATGFDGDPEDNSQVATGAVFIY